MTQNFKSLEVVLSVVLLLSSFGCSQKDRPTADKSSPSPSTPSPKTTLPTQIDGSESSSPAVAPTPKSSDDIWQYLYSSREELELCEGDIEPSVSQDISSVYRINEQQYLVEFLCFLGAYQGNYEYLLYDTTPTGVKVKSLSFDVFEPNGSGKFTSTNVSSISGLPDYEPEKQLLTVFTKYRGLADCGSLAKYKWEESEFKLLEYRVKEKCDGTYLEPDQYSQVYP